MALAVAPWHQLVSFIRTRTSKTQLSLWKSDAAISGSCSRLANEISNVIFNFIPKLNASYTRRTRCNFFPAPAAPVCRLFPWINHTPASVLNFSQRYGLHCEVRDEPYSQKTRMTGLSDAEDLMTSACFVHSQYQRVTDGQTDGRNCYGNGAPRS